MDKVRYGQNFMVRALFASLVVSLSWLFMMVLHESGHCIGAILTGGHIAELRLHPLSISETIVNPNPNPLIVVWLGPLLGVLIPIAAWKIIKLWHSPSTTLTKSFAFFAGFCLVANGCYIGCGAIDLIGDCKVMYEQGTSRTWMVIFGLASASLGLIVWHQLGSAIEYFKESRITINDLIVVSLLLACLVVWELWRAGF